MRCSTSRASATARCRDRRAERARARRTAQSGLLRYFDPIVISGDHGYRKPDRRLFQRALDGMGAAAAHALYVGNDMFRDIYGAREAGLTTLMFNSDQGAKAYRDCAPDYTITDFRDFLQILGLRMP